MATVLPTLSRSRLAGLLQGVTRNGRVVAVKNQRKNTSVKMINSGIKMPTLQSM